MIRPAQRPRRNSQGSHTDGLLVGEACCSIPPPVSSFLPCVLSISVTNVDDHAPCVRVIRVNSCCIFATFDRERERILNRLYGIASDKNLLG